MLEKNFKNWLKKFWKGYLVGYLCGLTVAIGFTVNLKEVIETTPTIISVGMIITIYGSLVGLTYHAYQSYQRYLVSGSRNI